MRKVINWSPQITVNEKMKDFVTDTQTYEIGQNEFDFAVKVRDIGGNREINDNI